MHSILLPLAALIGISIWGGRERALLLFAGIAVAIWLAGYLVGGSASTHPRSSNAAGAFTLTGCGLGSVLAAFATESQSSIPIILVMAGALFVCGHVSRDVQKNWRG